MTLTASLLAFTAAAALLAATPGLDTALVLRTAAVRGRRAALAAALGIALGCLCWGVIAAVGLGALLAASEIAYGLLKLAGAVYLVWLGARMLLANGSPAECGVAGEGENAFARGLLTNLLNPKVGAFYVSFLPQFIPEGAPVLLLTLIMTAIHATLGLLWFAAIIGAAARFADIFRRPPVMRLLNGIAGALCVALGLRLIFERRL